MARKAKQTKKTITNYIAIALDTSGSMGHIREEVRAAYNDMLRTIRERTEAEGHRTFVALVMFDSTVRVQFHPTDIKNVKDIPPGGYPISGQTALFDGVAKAVEVVGATAGAEHDVSYLVLVFTDGEENHSLFHNDRTIRRLIAEHQDGGNWTFAFQMPPRTGAAFARNFGIPAENIREWEQTTKGVEDVRATTQAGLTSYFGARSLGVKSVKNFYDVTTDLSAVKAKDVKKLEDVTQRFKSYTVDKECSISAFVEVKTGRPYVIGSTYYQLMKPEKVQQRKSVVLMEKGKKTVYGGPEARALVGLPPDGEAKVTPGNHSNYDIFVESCSVNRVLPRGTRVLVDIAQSASKAPTWDHTATKQK